MVVYLHAELIKRMKRKHRQYKANGGKLPYYEWSKQFDPVIRKIKKIEQQTRLERTK